MCIPKTLGLTLFAIFLVLTSVTSLLGVTPGPLGRVLMDLLEIASGVLILVSIRKFLPEKK